MNYHRIPPLPLSSVSSTSHSSFPFLSLRRFCFLILFIFFSLLFGSLLSVLIVTSYITHYHNYNDNNIITNTNTLTSSSLTFPFHFSPAPHGDISLSPSIPYSLSFDPHTISPLSYYRNEVLLYRRIIRDECLRIYHRHENSVIPTIKDFFPWKFWYSYHSSHANFTRNEVISLDHMRCLDNILFVQAAEDVDREDNYQSKKRELNRYLIWKVINAEKHMKLGSLGPGEKRMNDEDKEDDDGNDNDKSDHHMSINMTITNFTMWNFLDSVEKKFPNAILSPKSWTNPSDLSALDSFSLSSFITSRTIHSPHFDYSHGQCGVNGYLCCISYSIFGKNPKYIDMLIHNSQLIGKGKIFIGWKMRIYYDQTVPSQLVQKLENIRDHEGSPIELVDMSPTGRNFYISDPNHRDYWSSRVVGGYFYRYLIADDTTLSRWIIRDSDSELNDRDDSAVREWMSTGYSFHFMRDQPYHVKLNAGMWGGINYQWGGGIFQSHWGKSMAELIVNQFPPKWNETAKVLQAEKQMAYGPDQAFLREVIWPNSQYDHFTHDSFRCQWYLERKDSTDYSYGINAFSFPTERNEPWAHVGEVGYLDEPWTPNDVSKRRKEKLLNGKRKEFRPSPLTCRRDPRFLYG